MMPEKGLQAIRDDYILNIGLFLIPEATFASGVVENRRHLGHIAQDTPFFDAGCVLITLSTEISLTAR